MGTNHAMNGPFRTEPKPTSDAPSGERGRDRDSLFIKAEMRLPERNAHFEARIRNLSSGGLMAECPYATEMGEQVEVQLRNIGWVFGTIAWSAGNRFGMAFNAPIDPKLARKPVGNNNQMISIVHRPDSPQGKSRLF